MLTPKSARTAGIVACLLGVLAMVAGRFTAGVPQWMAYTGVVVIAAGWACFAYSIWKNIALARGRGQDTDGHP